MLDTTNNRIDLVGVVSSEPVFSHELYGEKFYTFNISTERLSEINDILPVLVSDRLINVETLKTGKKINIVGQLRSYNENINGKFKLILKVFVKEITEALEEENHKDIIELDGYICKEPIYRETPKGREICDLFLAVNRHYRKSDYIPTICWGRNAKFASELKVGDRVNITGRLQSRDYNKKIDEETYETHTTYEVSVSKLEFLYVENASAEQHNEVAVEE